MAVAFRAAGAAAPSATSTSWVVPAPTGTAVGDYLLLAVTTKAAAANTPAGWTLHASYTNNVAFNTYLFGRVAAASGSSANVTVIAPSATTNSSAMYGYIGQDPTSPVAGVVTASAVSPPSSSTAAAGALTVGSVGGLDVLMVAINATNVADTVNGAADRGSAFFDAQVDMFDAPETASGTQPARTVTWGPAHNESYAIHRLSLVAAPTAPAAPSPLAPAASAYVDAVGGVTFTNIYNSTDGLNQSAYALRVKVSGGAYNYWNAGTSALQSTVVWNANTTMPGGAWSVTLPAAATPNGSTYNWAAASQESGSNLQGPFAADSTFTTQVAPTAVINTPTSTTSTSQPTVIWTTTTPAGASQTGYRLVVEHGTYGTVPGLGTQDFDSGIVGFTGNNATVGSPLANGVTFRAFLQVIETGSEPSAWAFSTFTVVIAPPATPVLTGTWDTTNQRAVLTIQGRDNTLTTNQASLETDTSGWAAGANTTIARSTAQALDNIASLSLTAVAAGVTSSTTPTGVAGLAVLPSTTWTALCSARAAVTARTFTVGIVWYTAAGATISTSLSTAVGDTTAGWAQAAVTVTSPATAAFAAVVVTVSTPAIGEVHYLDQISLAPAASTAWTRGGLAGAGTVNVQRTTDGGVTWVSVRGASATALPAPSQLASVSDYEVLPTASAGYRATVTDVV